MVVGGGVVGATTRYKKTHVSFEDENYSWVMSCWAFPVFPHTPTPLYGRLPFPPLRGILLSRLYFYHSLTPCRLSSPDPLNSHVISFPTVVFLLSLPPFCQSNPSRFPPCTTRTVLFCIRYRIPISWPHDPHAKYLRHSLRYCHAQATIEPPKPPELQSCDIANGEILVFGTKTAFNNQVSDHVSSIESDPNNRYFSYISIFF